MDKKERYLRNPHITLDEKRKRQLGISTEDFRIPKPKVKTQREVVLPSDEEGETDAGQ